MTTQSNPSTSGLHSYDVVVVGAGGAGLRAAIESSRQGAKTAIICKSLLGKAHTVMAEGGAAAALALLQGGPRLRSGRCSLERKKRKAPPRNNLYV